MTSKRVQKTPQNLENGKVPPNSLELEESVLGAILMFPDSLYEVVDVLKVNHFYYPNHQLIYEVVLSLFKQSKPVDTITVTFELKKIGKLETIGGVMYLSQLTDRISVNKNLEYYTLQLMGLYVKRSLGLLGINLIDTSYKSETDGLELIDSAENQLLEIRSATSVKREKTIEVVMANTIKEIERAATIQGGVTGVPSGFNELDKYTAGFQKGDLIIVAGRPGMGKTAFGLSVCNAVGVKEKRPIAYFSLEMSSEQIGQRLLSINSQIPISAIRTGSIDEWDKFNQFASLISNSSIFIDDTPGLNPVMLRSRAKRMKLKYGIEMLVVDYLGLMRSVKESKNRNEEVQEISYNLKLIAKELEIPVIALSQLSRDVEKRGGTKRPVLSDLRDSGAIEQDADLIMFLYRPEYYHIESDANGNSTKGKAEVIIAKQRNGSIGSFWCDFKGDTVTYAPKETFGQLAPAKTPYNIDEPYLHKGPSPF